MDVYASMDDVEFFFGDVCLLFDDGADVVAVGDDCGAVAKCFGVECFHDVVVEVAKGEVC